MASRYEPSTSNHCLLLSHCSHCCGPPSHCCHCSVPTSHCSGPPFAVLPLLCPCLPLLSPIALSPSPTAPIAPSPSPTAQSHCCVPLSHCPHCFPAPTAKTPGHMRYCRCADCSKRISYWQLLRAESDDRRGRHLSVNEQLGETMSQAACLQLHARFARCALMHRVLPAVQIHAELLAAYTF